MSNASNARKEIRDKIVQMLTESGRLPQVETVQSNRIIPLQDKKLPAVIVFNGGDNWESVTARGSRYQVTGTVMLDCVVLGKQPPEVKSAEDDRIDDQLDEIGTEIESILVGDTPDQSLEGVVIAFRLESNEFSISSSEQQTTVSRGVLRMTFNYTYSVTIIRP